MIAAAGLRKQVAIVGHIREMNMALEAADAVVVPSTEPEAFGRTAVEAQAMAKPVIASGHGGLAETVADGLTGILVPPSDSKALAEAIEHVLDMSPEQRAAMGRQGRDRARRLYSKAALQASTLRVYDRLIGVRS
jgi:glycosyltransferase involved in cell wall biosynthesis